MDNLYITLRMDMTAQAPEGPGWYIDATDKSQRMIPLTSISTEAAQELAGAFQRALESTEGELPQITIPHLAQSASGLMRQALEKQLKFAEEQAAKIVTIRRKLALVPPPK